MKGFPYVIEIPIRFRDMDALGHVNNATYLTYLEEARVAFVREAFKLPDIRKIDIILARVEIDYRTPAFCGETLVVGLRPTKVGGASFEVGYRIEDKATGRLVAEAKTVLVGFDFGSNKVVRLSAERAALLRRDLPPSK